MNSDWFGFKILFASTANWIIKVQNHPRGPDGPCAGVKAGTLWLINDTQSPMIRSIRMADFLFFKKIFLTLLKKN